MLNQVKVNRIMLNLMKKFLSIALIIAIVNGNVNVSYGGGETDYESEIIWSGGIEYQVKHYSSGGSSALIIGYNKNEINSDVVIPYYVPGTQYIVNSVSDYAFVGNKTMKTLTINGCCHITYSSFFGCTNLESVIINQRSDYQVDISDVAFIGCSNLREFIVNEPDDEDDDYDDEGQLIVIDGGLYSSDAGSGYKYQLICYPAARNVTTYTIPDGTQYNSWLHGNLLCGNTNIKSISTLDNEHYKVVDGVLFSQDMKKLYCYPAGKEDEIYRIPDGVTSIEDGAFYNAIHLKELYIPDSVKYVSDDHTPFYFYSFGVLDTSSSCNINPSDGIVNISSIFNECKEEFRKFCSPNQELMIYCGSDSVVYDLAKYMADWVGTDDYGLNLNGKYYFGRNAQQPETTTKQPETTTKQPETTTKQPETTTKQPETTTKQPETTTKQPETTTKQPETTTKQPETTTQQETTTVRQEETTTDYQRVDPMTKFTYDIIYNSYVKITGYAGSYDEIVIPEKINGNKVLRIAAYAFREYSDLTSIEISNSVTSIGTGAFSGCSNLTNIELSDSVTDIAESTFANCKKLTNITIPDSVKNIRKMAFKGCSGLTNITIPDSVTDIESYAFYGCSNLTSITLPNQLKSIGSSAFRGCSSLRRITIPDSVVSFGEGAFSECNNIVIKCTKDSYAYQWALENIIPVDTGLENAITGKATYTMTSSDKEQSLTLDVKATGGNLEFSSNNSDILVNGRGIVTIAPNYVGRVKITVTAGDSTYNTATKVITIKVIPESTKIITAKNSAKGKMQIKWGKVNNVTGYQIQYGLNKAAKSGFKSFTVKKASMVKKTISKLNKGKTYYIRIRTYKKVSGKNIYSKWSSMKKVKIKK